MGEGSATQALLSTCLSHKQSAVMPCIRLILLLRVRHLLQLGLTESMACRFASKSTQFSMVPVGLGLHESS